MQWKKRTSATTVAEVVSSMSGQTVEDLLSPTSIPGNKIENLKKAAETILLAAKKKKQFFIMGDYDADGITSSSILYCLFKRIGIKNLVVRLPRRFSEGYGLKKTSVEGFDDDGILICVDNGITAFDAIQKAKEKHMTVVILDHHTPGEKIPNADVIVDPHLHPEKNGFEHYCGAGLAFKLAELLYKKIDPDFVNQMMIFAAIGTVADVMPLIGDNRNIVQKGLHLMNTQPEVIPPGVSAIIEVCKLWTITETDIGFKIGPMLNAAGRMYDEGASFAFQTLIASSEEAIKRAEVLLKVNKKRQETVSSAMIIAEEYIHENRLEDNVPIIVNLPVPEGILGIIAGKIAEKYNTPAFAVAAKGTTGLLTGSGRSCGDFDIMKMMNDVRVKSLMHSMGGHPKAAGLSFEASLFHEVQSNMKKAAADIGYIRPSMEIFLYDLECSISDLPDIYGEIERFAPYGEGNPKPVLMVKDILLSPRNGQTCRFMGSHCEHIKLYAKEFSVLIFHEAKKYIQMDKPQRIDVCGTVSKNIFKGIEELQIEALEFKQAKNNSEEKSDLFNELLAIGAIAI